LTDKSKIIDFKDVEKMIKDGKLKRVHLYDFQNVLHPRGPMQKESVGFYLLERLKGSWEEWTKEGYTDNPSRDKIKEQLYQNLMNEAATAYEEFLHWLNTQPGE
jgi:hypothetical protein